jgi:hypothetical protein
MGPLEVAARGRVLDLDPRFERYSPRRYAAVAAITTAWAVRGSIVVAALFAAVSAFILPWGPAPLAQIGLTVSALGVLGPLMAVYVVKLMCAPSWQVLEALIAALGTHEVAARYVVAPASHCRKEP